MSSLHGLFFGLEVGLRWLARLLAAFFIGVVLLFLIGAGGLNPLQLAAREAVLMVFFFTTCSGLVVGWRYEGIGGMMVVVGMLSFYASHVAATGCFPNGWVFPLIFLPGLLFLLSSFLRRRRFRQLVLNP